MMSSNDGPTVTSPPGEGAGGAGAGAADDTEMKQLWRFIYVDMKFIKSLYGIFIAAELVLSLCGLICVSVPKEESCAYLHSGTYSYYEFVTSSCFIVSIVWYILYGLAITKKLSFVRWDITEIIWCGFYVFNFLISSSVIAAHSCFQGGYKAAAAFGFLCLFVIIAHGFFIGRTFMEKLRGSGRSASSAAAGQEPDPDESKY